MNSHGYNHLTPLTTASFYRGLSGYDQSTLLQSTNQTECAYSDSNFAFLTPYENINTNVVSNHPGYFTGQLEQAEVFVTGFETGQEAQNYLETQGQGEEVRIIYNLQDPNTTTSNTRSITPVLPVISQTPRPETLGNMASGVLPSSTEAGRTVRPSRPPTIPAHSKGIRMKETSDISEDEDQETGRGSSSERSENEHPVTSPTGGVQELPPPPPPPENSRRKNKKKRKRQSSSSSSTSSDESSKHKKSSDSQDRKDRRKAKKKHKKRRSRSRSCSTTRQVVSYEADDHDRNLGHAGGSSQASVEQDVSTTPKQILSFVPELVNCPPPVSHIGPASRSRKRRAKTPCPAIVEVNDLNRQVFDQISQDKSKTSCMPTDDESLISAATSTAKPRKPLELPDVLKYLPETVPKDSKLVMKVIRALMQVLKPKQLIEQIKYISPFPGIIVQSGPEDDTPHIDATSYLFSNTKTIFGLDFESWDKRPSLTKQSLAHALVETHDEQKNSLDVVLRLVIKELAFETEDFADESQGPKFISGRLLELRLLYKIYEYYKNLLGKDIIEHLTKAATDEDSPFYNLTKDCSCLMYIKKLTDRYSLRGNNALLEEIPKFPNSMRVWTDLSSQAVTNSSISSFVELAYEECMSENPKSNDEVFAFFRKKMQPLMEKYNGFLRDMLRASELMTFMCFGIVSNYPDGPLLMAASRIMLSGDKELKRKYPTAFWNYPLASRYRPEPISVPSKPSLSITGLLAHVNYFETRVDDD